MSKICDRLVTNVTDSYIWQTPIIYLPIVMIQKYKTFMNLRHMHKTNIKVYMLAYHCSSSMPEPLDSSWSSLLRIGDDCRCLGSETDGVEWWRSIISLLLPSSVALSIELEVGKPWSNAGFSPPALLFFPNTGRFGVGLLWVELSYLQIVYQYIINVCRLASNGCDRDL